MATTLVLHRVADYDAWRKVYDSVAPMQKAAGVAEEHVYRMKDDPNNVLVLHRFGSMQQAETFFHSADLRDALQRAGVEGMPRIEFFEEA